MKKAKLSLKKQTIVKLSTREKGLRPRNETTTEIYITGTTTSPEL